MAAISPGPAANRLHGPIFQPIPLDLRKAIHMRGTILVCALPVLVGCGSNANRDDAKDGKKAGKQDGDDMPIELADSSHIERVKGGGSHLSHKGGGKINPPSEGHPYFYVLDNGYKGSCFELGASTPTPL